MAHNTPWDASCWGEGYDIIGYDSVKGPGTGALLQLKEYFSNWAIPYDVYTNKFHTVLLLCMSSKKQNGKNGNRDVKFRIIKNCKFSLFLLRICLLWWKAGITIQYKKRKPFFCFFCFVFVFYGIGFEWLLYLCCSHIRQTLNSFKLQLVIGKGWYEVNICTSLCMFPFWARYRTCVVLVRKD